MASGRFIALEHPMKRLPALAARPVALGAVLAAALMTSGCITVIDADHEDGAWHGNNAQPFDAARADCDDRTESRDAFGACMAEKGWTRS